MGMMSASPCSAEGPRSDPHCLQGPSHLPARRRRGHRREGENFSGTQRAWQHCLPSPLPSPLDGTGSPVRVEGGGGETRTRTWVLCFYGSCSCSLRGGVSLCGFQSREVVNGGRESGTPGDSRKRSAEPRCWGTAVLPWDGPSREEIPGDSWLLGQAGRSPRPLASAGTSPPAPSLLPLGSDLLWSHLLIDHTP